LIEHRGGTIEIAFFGFEGPVAAMAFGKFNVADLRAERLKISLIQKIVLPEPSQPREPKWFTMGEKAAINRLELAGDFWTASGTVPAICRLIQTEIDDVGPDGVVGPPVQIVCLTQRGVQEMEYDPPCAEARGRCELASGLMAPPPVTAPPCAARQSDALAFAAWGWGGHGALACTVGGARDEAKTVCGAEA
jgi:hypothetical protein